MGLKTSLNVTMQKALSKFNHDHQIQTYILTISEFMLILASQQTTQNIPN